MTSYDFPLEITTILLRGNHEQLFRDYRERNETASTELGKAKE